MSRLADYLQAVATTLRTAGVPVTLLSGDIGPAAALQLLPAKGRTGAAGLWLSGLDGAGPDDSGQTVLCRVNLVLVSWDPAGEALGVLERIEALSTLVRGQTWGLRTDWLDPAGEPSWANQAAAARAAEGGPGGASLWTLAWTQTLRLATPTEDGRADPNLSLITP
jgi:hypothetical protein